MSNHIHGQAALDVATKVMGLVNGPKLLGGDAQLKAKIHSRIIDALEVHGRKPVVDEPVYQYQGLCGEWLEVNKEFYEYKKNRGYTVRILWIVPPVTVQGDDGVWNN